MNTLYFDWDNYLVVVVQVWWMRLHVVVGRPKRSDLNEVVWVTYSPVSSVVVGHPYYGFR